MKLLAKFNLILLSVFGVGGLIIAWFAYSFLISNARREVLDQARLMVANAKAVRDYTADDLSPLVQQAAKHGRHLRLELDPMPMLRQTATLQIKLEGAEGQGWVLQHISAG